VWQYEPFEADYVGDFSLAMGDECLYLMGNVFREQGNQGLLIKLDRSGNEIWRENSPVGYHSMAVLDNGNVVLSGSEGDKDFLIVKSPDNEVLYEMKAVPIFLKCKFSRLTAALSPHPGE
jgi:outer membrane protein assembly factor BamB